MGSITGQIRYVQEYGRTTAPESSRQKPNRRRLNETGTLGEPLGEALFRASTLKRSRGPSSSRRSRSRQARMRGVTTLPLSECSTTEIGVRDVSTQDV